MQFSELVAAVRKTPLDVTIPADWGQGRASFGGLVVALQYEAMRAQISVERALRSLAVSLSVRWQRMCRSDLKSRCYARARPSARYWAALYRMVKW